MKNVAKLTRQLAHVAQVRAPLQWHAVDGQWRLIQQRGIVDEIMLNHIPIVLGGGERLFDGVPWLKAQPIEVAASPLATHVVYRIERT